MLSIKVINARFRNNLCTAFLLSLLVGMVSCTGRKSPASDGETEGLTKEEEDLEWEEDTLVYDIPDAVVPETVDESFLDFLYTFMHQRSFQLKRVAYPIEVRDKDGMVTETLGNGRTVSHALSQFSPDNIVLLLKEDQDPYDYMSLMAEHAEIQQIDVRSGVSRSYAFDRRDGEWMFTGIHSESEDKVKNFIHYYHQFTNDSIFRENHLAAEIFVTLPSSDDEMDMLDGNIDSGQWDVFSPELPRETLLVLDLGQGAEDGRSVKFVKFGVASSMMEVLTFGWDDGDWKLIRYEE